MDGKRAMKMTIRSSFVVLGVLGAWLPDFFAGVHGQSTAHFERVRVGVYPATITPANAQAGAAVRAETDSIFARLAAQITSALVSALQEENLNTLPPASFATFLRARPALDPFHPDSVRTICAAFALQKLVLPLLTASASDPAALQEVRLILRWLDGASGETTKFHVSAHEVKRNGTGAALSLANPFEAKALIQALLSAPELILAQEPAAAPLPLLQELPPAPAAASEKSRKWWWYLSAAAVIGGGSAYWFLGREAAADQPVVLPEPPGPPP